VRSALEKIDGVASAEANFETKKATLTMQPGRSLTRADVDKAFEGTKYTVATFDPVAGG